METSAKDNFNVQTAFDDMSKNIFHNLKDSINQTDMEFENLTQGNQTINIFGNKTSTKEKKCC